MSEEGGDRWRDSRNQEDAQSSSSKRKHEVADTARPSTSGQSNQDIPMAEPVPIDSSDEEEVFTNIELEQALLKIGLLKISDGKLIFTASVPPFNSRSGGVFITQVVDEVEGEPPKKKRKPTPSTSYASTSELPEPSEVPMPQLQWAHAPQPPQPPHAPPA